MLLKVKCYGEYVDPFMQKRHSCVLKWFESKVKNELGLLIVGSNYIIAVNYVLYRFFLSVTTVQWFAVRKKTDTFTVTKFYKLYYGINDLWKIMWHWVIIQKHLYRKQLVKIVMIFHNITNFIDFLSFLFWSN